MTRACESKQGLRCADKDKWHAASAGPELGCFPCVSSWTCSELKSPCRGLQSSALDKSAAGEKESKKKEVEL